MDAGTGVGPSSPKYSGGCIIQIIGAFLSTIGAIVALFETFAHETAYATLTLAWAIWTFLITREWRD